MIAKVFFFVAIALFTLSLFEPAVVGEGGKSVSGIETFYYTLRYGTAGLLGARSAADFVLHFVALVAAAANFVFVFWAMLAVAPTRVPTLSWFWWVSLLFLLAAAYTGLQAQLSGSVALAKGYFLWLAALALMFASPVVARYERRCRKRIGEKGTRSSGDQSLA